MSLEVIRPSSYQHKKYDVFRDNKYVLSFGDSRHQHYKDKLGHFKHLDHNDEKRRERFHKRMKSIKKSDGKLAYRDKNSPLYYSMMYLW